MSHEPTIVLVHGAFADGSSWNGVVERLLEGGHHVVAPANPLRGVAADSAYIASYVSQIDGPTILVGHSYGGAVISNAAARPRMSSGWCSWPPMRQRMVKPSAAPGRTRRTGSSIRRSS